MAKITIHKDGSFESLAAVDYKQKIAQAKVEIKTNKELLRGERRALATLKRIAIMKASADANSGEKKEKFLSSIKHLRMQKGISPRSTLSSVKARILRLEKSIIREQNNIEKWKEKLGIAKAKPVAKSVPEKKPAAKVEKSSPKPQPKIRIVPASDKKTGNTLAKMQASYAEITEQLKHDMPPSKKSRLRSERARLRVMIAELKRGQRAANKKATENKAKPSGNMGSSKSKVVPKSGMGSAASKATADTKSIRKAVGSVLSLGTLTAKEMKNIHWSRSAKGIKLESSQYNIVGAISEKTANNHKTSLDEIEEYLKEHGKPLKPKRVKPFRSLYD